MKRFAFVAIILATCVTSFAATNLPSDQRASGQAAEPYDEGGGYSAINDPIWVNFFGGGFGGGAVGDSGWESPGPTKMACVRCAGDACEGVAGGRAFAFCKFDPKTGKCTETGTCWSE